MRKADFLFVVRGSENYGVERKLISLMAALRSRGYAVRVYAIGGGGFADQAALMLGADVHIDDNVPARFVGKGLARIAAFGRSMMRAGELARRLLLHLRAHPADRIVFCEHGLLLPIGRAARGARTPVFWLMPNLVSGDYPLDLNRRIYAWAFRRYGMVAVANSAATRLSLGRAARGARQIDLGVDPVEFAAPVAPAPSPFPEGVNRDHPVLLVMARLVPEKGQRLLVEALMSRPEFASVRLAICGGPLGTPYAQAIEELVRRHGAIDRIRLVGPVSHPQAWYALADVAIGLRIDPEPFGLSIVEAMMAGKPVLVHALGGPAEIVLDDLTGWHVRTMDVETVADGLQRVLRDRPRWLEMGLAGKSRALERYTVAAMTADFLKAVTLPLAQAD